MRLLAVCIMALAFGFIGSMPLAGPIAILSVSRASQKRYGEALRIGLGAAAAEGIYAGIAFWGFTTFLASHAIVEPISHATTALVMAAVGVRFMFWRPQDPAAERRPSRGNTVLVGFSVSALNPTLILTWSAAVAFLYSKGLKQPSALYAIPFGACGAAGVGSWFVVLVELFKRFGGKLPSGVLTWTVRTMGMVLAALGIWSGVQFVQWMHAPKSTASTTSHSTCSPS